MRKELKWQFPSYNEISKDELARIEYENELIAELDINTGIKRAVERGLAQGEARGLAQGMARGKAEALREVAASLAALGVGTDQIIEAAGLSEAEISALSRQK